ncbi:MAG: cytidylate kinase-like family protein [Oscillospiraceae bacterium]|nr:cytidylate kinase-like family protein [Oscillospiraceae bacterium]
MDHFIITIARETGSGGRNIAAKLSEQLNIPFYDRDLLRLASDVSGIREGLFGESDERIGKLEMMTAAKKIYSGEILPPDDDDFISTKNLFEFQAKVIKELASSRVSCIIVGRCADYLLSNRSDVLRVFIHAPLESRKKNVAYYSLAWSEKEITKYIFREDKRRAEYYRYYTGNDWRDAAHFDISLDSTVLGEDGCAETIKKALPIFTH